MAEPRKMTEKMAESSDQSVSDKPAGQPPFEKNIKELSEDEVKRKSAEKMSERGGKSKT